jgi:amidophosphoribosyltransferase
MRPFHAHPFDDDKLKEECGVFGVIGVSDAANFVALGMHALQHRGQEAGGIVAYHPEPASTRPAASAMCATISPTRR